MSPRRLNSASTRVVERMDERKRAEIAEALSEQVALEDKLLRACLVWGLHGAELAAAHPDAADLFDLRFPVVRRVYADFEALVAVLIEEAHARAGVGGTPADLARTLVYGMRGLRGATDSLAELRRLVELQVRLFVRSLAPPF